MITLLIVTNLYSSDQKKILNDLKNAALIENDDIRLKLYDSILEKNNLKLKKQNVPALKTKWEVSVDTNPIDDTKTYLFYLIADEGKSSWNQNVILMIRKSSSGDELFINWGSYLGTEIFVTLRIGKSDATNSQWNLSTDSKATFYSGSTIDLIKEISKSDRVVAQCTPYNENPITAIFDVKGFREIAYKYNSELGWFDD